MTEDYIIEQEAAFREEFKRQTESLKKQKKKLLAFLDDGRMDLAIAFLEEQNKSWLPWFYDVYQKSVASELDLQNDFIFDPTKTEEARKKIAEFLLLLNDIQKQLFTYVVNEGWINGESDSTIVNRWQKLVGLTETQARRIQDFRAKLLNQQRIDRLSQDAGEEITPLKDGEIEALVDQRVSQMIDARADMDARNFISQIDSTGRMAVINQILDDNPEATAEKGWRSRRDDRVRRTHTQHEGMDGQWRPLDGYFNSPSGARLFQPHDPSAPISETANCRCFLLYRVKYNRS